MTPFFNPFTWVSHINCVELQVSLPGRAPQKLASLKIKIGETAADPYQPWLIDFGICSWVHDGDYRTARLAVLNYVAHHKMHDVNIIKGLQEWHDYIQPKGYKTAPEKLKNGSNRTKRWQPGYGQFKEWTEFLEAVVKYWTVRGFLVDHAASNNKPAAETSTTPADESAL